MGTLDHDHETMNLRGRESAWEMGWLHPIGRGENHIVSEAMSPSLVSAQKIRADRGIATETRDVTME